MEERDTNLNPLKTIEISKLKPYSKHPYKPYTNDKLNELADSIKEQGLIVPIIVRPITDKEFTHEIIAGHV